MATRRDVLPGKEKATCSPQTVTSNLKAAVNKITKTNASAAPKKQTKPTTKTMPTDVSKQQVKKPAIANKPAQTRTKPSVNKTVASPKPAPKTCVVSAAAPAPSRSSTFPSKAAASPKPVTGKSLKTVTKDEGKRRLSPSASNARRSSIGLKKQETGTSSSATKEQPQITNFTVDKVVDQSIYCVPEPEIQLKDIEAYLAQAEEKMVHSLSDAEKGSTDVLVTDKDQEPMYFAKVGDEIDPADSTVVIAESYPVSEEQETPLDIKIQETKNKHDREASSSKQELEYDTKKTNSCDNEKLAGNCHEEAEEQEVKDVKEVKVRAEQQAAAVVSKVDESKEIERPLSNNVIEETSSKLRAQRINKVRALAGAFETVISLQEK